MQPHDPTVQALAERVAKLEAQNRRLRTAGMVAVVAASAVVVMGQAHTSRVLEANEFVLKDDSGTVRARLLMNPNGPTLTFYRDKTHVSASLAGGDEPSILLVGEGASSLLRSSDFNMGGKTGSFVLDVGEEGPSLNIEDKEGYTTTLGRTDLVLPASGRKERTPAASLVLFGKDRKVLWSAP